MELLFNTIIFFFCHFFNTKKSILPLQFNRSLYSPPSRCNTSHSTRCFQSCQVKLRTHLQGLRGARYCFVGDLEVMTVADAFILTIPLFLLDLSSIKVRPSSLSSIKKTVSSFVMVIASESIMRVKEFIDNFKKKFGDEGLDSFLD